MQILEQSSIKVFEIDYTFFKVTISRKQEQVFT